jgi:hypothetical protein
MDATEIFRNLGGSWKRLKDTTRGKKRRMHGSAGEGRFRAFGVQGEKVRWETIEAGDSRVMTEIIAYRSNLSGFEVLEQVRRGLRVSTARATAQRARSVDVRSVVSRSPRIRSSPARTQRMPDVELRAAEGYAPTVVSSLHSCAGVRSSAPSSVIATMSSIWRMVLSTKVIGSIAKTIPGSNSCFVCGFSIGYSWIERPRL